MTTNNTTYQREYMQGYRKRIRNRIIQILGGKCVVCGTTEKLQVHHKINCNRKDNETDTFEILRKSWKKTPANHILFCMYHHEQYHIRGE